MSSTQLNHPTIPSLSTYTYYIKTYTYAHHIVAYSPIYSFEAYYYHRMNEQPNKTTTATTMSDILDLRFETEQKMGKRSGMEACRGEGGG